MRRSYLAYMATMLARRSTDAWMQRESTHGSWRRIEQLACSLESDQEDRDWSAGNDGCAGIERHGGHLIAGRHPARTRGASALRRGCPAAARGRSAWR